MQANAKHRVTRHIDWWAATGCLVLALTVLLSQSIGLRHRFEHLPGLGLASNPQAATRHAALDASAQAWAGEAKAPVAPPHDPGSALCQILDQLLTGAGPCTGTVVLDATASSARPSEGPRPSHEAGDIGHHLARGPPLARIHEQASLRA